MDKFEYRVVPAPTKAKRGRWVRGAATRFADRLEHIFNEMGADGWEYIRTDTLPNEERVGLTQKTVTYRNLLVFRRTIPVEPPVEMPAMIADATPKQTVALLTAPTPEERSANNAEKFRAKSDAALVVPAVLAADSPPQVDEDQSDFVDAKDADTQATSKELPADPDADTTQSTLENVPDDDELSDDWDVTDYSGADGTGPMSVALSNRAQKENTDADA